MVNHSLQASLLLPVAAAEWLTHLHMLRTGQTDGPEGGKEAQTRRGNVKGQFQKERKMLLLLSHTFGKLQLRL